MKKSTIFSLVKAKSSSYPIHGKHWIGSMLVSVVLLMSFAVANAQLAGTYTINSQNPTSGSNFNSFAAFQSALSSAGNAIAGPVTINVVSGSGPYNEQIVLGTISGAGPGTGGSRIGITINGNGEKLYYSGSGGTENAVITLNGTDYMTFSNLIIERGSSGSYRWGVRLTNNADNNRFDGCTVDVGAYSTTYQMPIIGTASNTSYSSYGVHWNGLEVWDCHIVGGYGGIFSYGTGSSSGTWKNGTDISNCTFTDQYYYPIFLYYGHYNVKVHANYFEKVNQSYQYGYAMYLYYANNIVITKNHNVGYCYGFMMYYINYYNTGLVNGRSLVANNMMCPNDLPGSVTTQYGIRGYYNYDVDYVYNSINLDASGLSTGYPLYIYYPKNPVVINNVIKSSASGTNYIYLYNASGTVTYDYNTFYNENSNYLFYYGTTSYSTLSALQSGSGQCSNCQEADPFYVSSTDLHTFGANLYQKGIAFSGVTDDIDGTSRPSVPSHGCHEFTPPQYDAGVVTFNQPVAVCPDTNDVIVTVKNFGVQKLTAFKIHWSWTGNTGSGADSMQINVSGSGLVTGADTMLKLLDVVMTAGAPGYTFYAWTTKPNGQVDETPSNDSLMHSTQTAMSGTYTIGGTSPDFSTITAAVTALNNFDICAAVVFNIRGGTYNERIPIGPLAGSNSTNTITFQKDPASSTAVAIQFNASSSAEDGLVLLDGSSYINFSELEIQALNNSGFGTPFWTKSASHINVTNCKIYCATGNTYDINLYIEQSEYMNFENCEMRYGSYGAYFYGNSADYTKGVTVTNCTFSDIYSYGFYIYYSDEISLNGNMVDVRGTKASQTSYGIYIYSYNGKTYDINKNYIAGNYYNYMYLGGTSQSHPRITNNKFHCGDTNMVLSYAIYGCYIYAGYYDFYHNLVISESNYSSTYYNAYLNGGLGKSKNNIFARVGNGYGIYVGGSFSLTESDYNAFALYGNASNGLSYMQNMGYDEHSVEVSMLYDDLDSLFTCNDTLVNAGTPIASVPDDINGNTRSTVAPTIGPVEYVSPGGFTLGDDIKLCTGDTVYIGQEIFGATYSWTPNGDTTGIIMVTAPGTYGITMTTGCGLANDDITVENGDPTASYNYANSWLTAIFQNASTNSDTYSWDFGDGSSVSTVENPIHLYAQTDTYNVCLTSSGDCGDAMTCMDVFVTDYVGIDENAVNAIKLYPNPASDVLTIDVQGVKGDVLSIEFNNIAGQQVMTRRLNDFNGNAREQVDISDMERGVYFVKVYTNEVTITKRLVVQK